MSLNDEQPDPKKNNFTPIWHLVIQDMQERNQVGIAKYGTPLQSFNGRDALMDLYQELLDASVYIRQKIQEETHKTALEQCYLEAEKASDECIAALITKLERLTKFANVFRKYCQKDKMLFANKVMVEADDIQHLIQALDENMDTCSTHGVAYEKCDC